MLLIAATTAGTVLASCGGNSNYSVTAVFPSAEGLFPGNAVEVLGVDRGSVTAVTPQAGQVVVRMAVDGAQALPADVRAVLVSPQLLGEPSIELSPGYTSGPKLADGAVIPRQRTSVPESIDQLLRDLQSYLGQVNGTALGGLVTNLAQDLQGQGQALNQLIANGAGTLDLLAQKGNELGQLNGSLAQITGMLRQRTASVTSLLQSYDTVAHVLATDSGPLGDSIAQLAQASQQISALLDPNLTPLQGDISTITQVGRTLDRNLGSLDQGLSSSVALFAAAQRAYDPVHKWLDLNTQLAPGTTSGVLAGLVRDRLAGICRRVLANHSAGLSQSQIQTLQTCGNPNSGFFDGLLGAIPTLLTSATGSQPPAPSPQDLLSQGAAQIPGLSSTQRSSVSSVPPSSLAGSPNNSSPALGGGPALPASPPLVSNQQANATSGGGLGGLLHGLFSVVHVFAPIGRLLGGVAHFFGSLL
ncbi:MAG TPA: MlaD family protein [Acidimicrobiales bacterium]|nr:MlaD family protein [Acidimicrobiales bacterium]